MLITNRWLASSLTLLWAWVLRKRRIRGPR
jgi:hypothetical protein